MGIIQLKPPSCYLCGSTELVGLGQKTGRAVVRCQVCGLVFVFPRPDGAHILSYYQDRFWSEYHARSGHPDVGAKFDLDLYLAQGRLKEIRRYQPQGRLLDVGCSYGALVKAAGEMGFTALGCDLSPQAVAFGQERHGLDLWLGTTSDLEPAAEAFEVITLIDLIEHLPDPLSELRRMEGLLAPEGVVAVETMDIGSPLFQASPMNWWATAPEEHLFMFSRATLARLAEAAGFKVDFVGYPTYPDRIFFICQKVHSKLRPAPRQRTVLLSRPLALGDVLWTTPLIKALKKAEPETDIHFQTRFPEALAHNPFLAAVTDQPTNLIHDRHLTLHYEFHPDRHILEGYFLSAGLSFEPADPEIFLTPEEKARAGEILSALPSGPGPLVGIHAGLRFAERSWEWFKWDRLALELLSRLGARLVVLGQGQDFRLAPWPGVLDLVSRLSLREMFAVVARLDLFVGLDSGPLHVAVAQGVPAVGLFGPVDPELRRPFGRVMLPVTSQVSCLGCLAGQPRPSFKVECRQEKPWCMIELSVAKVLAAVPQVLPEPWAARLSNSPRRSLADLAQAAGPFPERLELVPTPAGVPSLRIHEPGRPPATLHSLRDPLAEGRQWAERAQAQGTSDNLVVGGLGLGHHLAALLRDPAFQGQAVVLEPDAQIFRLALAAGVLEPFLYHPRLLWVAGLPAAEAMARFKTLGLPGRCRTIIHQPSARLNPVYYQALFEALK